VSQIKRWNGSSWSAINPKRWNGGSWVEVEAYKWDGGKWVNMTSQQYTSSWGATWTQTYRESGGKRTNSGDLMYQGRFNDYYTSWGLMTSMAGFNDADMRSKLAGARIDRVQLYLRSQHWYYYSGGTAYIGYHNVSGEPSSYSSVKYGAKTQKFTSRGHAMWVDMPIDFGNGLRDGRYRGIVLDVNSTSHNYYGYFYGASSGYRPQIKITYTK
jgi:hypothetical protein